MFFFNFEMTSLKQELLLFYKAKDKAKVIQKQNKKEKSFFLFF